MVVNKSILFCLWIPLVVFCSPTISIESSVKCADCVCSVASGANLSLATFTTQFEHGSLKYYFAFCGATNNTPCAASVKENSTLMVCIAESSRGKEDTCSWSEEELEDSWIELATSSLYLHLAKTDCSLTRSISPIVVLSCMPQLINASNYSVVIPASGEACQQLKHFNTTTIPSSIPLYFSTNTSSSSPASTHSSSAISSTSSTTPPVPIITTNLSATTVTSTIIVSPTTTAKRSTVATGTPSSITTTTASANLPTPTAHKGDGDDNRLLYIVIPTAVPVSFVLTFFIVFCLLRGCDRQRKKRLYIRLTPTVYADQPDSDDSD